MKQQFAKVDPAEIEHIEFDGTKLCTIPAEPEAAQEMGWQLVEPASDEHIAILEKFIEDAQARLAEIRAERDKPSK